MDNLRGFFLISTFPFGIDSERICNRPDSIDSSLGGSSDTADDTCGKIPAEQSLSVYILKNFHHSKYINLSKRKIVTIYHT